MKESYSQTLILVTGTIINSFLGLVFYVLVARILDIAAFGYFSYLLGLGLVAAELADLGINAAIVKFGAAEKFPTIFSFSLVQRSVAFLLIILLFFVAGRVFDAGLIYAGYVGIALLLSYLATQSLLARQKYLWQVGVNIFGNLSRLTLILFLIKASLLTPVSTLVAFCLGGATTFLLGIAPIIAEFSWSLWEFRRMLKTAREVFRFSLPAAGSFSLASLAGKLDIPIIFALSGPIPAGLYSSAQKLVSVLPQVAAALDGVFAPKFSSGGNFPKIFREYIILAIFLAVAIVVFIPIAGLVVPLVFGLKYAPAVAVFQILLVGGTFLFLSGPFAAAILYRLGKPLVSLEISALASLATLGLYFLLVPQFNGIGAAVSAAAGSFVGLCFYVLKWRRFSSSPI